MGGGRKYCKTSSTNCKCSQLSMIGGAFVAGLVVASVILVPALSLSQRKSCEENNNTVYTSHSSVQHSPLFVAAFNIKSFGVSKSQDEYVLKHVVKIMSRYDVILVQEVRDKQYGTALRELWQQLNATGIAYGLVHSGHLGRTTYKEQYAFFYRIHAAKLTGSVQYNDSAEDEFEREPFTVEFEYYSVKDGLKKQMAFMALHAKPAEVKTELAKLPAVMKLTLGHFPRSAGIIALGDFNADCSYLSKKKKNELEVFRKDGSFKSIIQDSADTTVASSTDCAYDRAVTYPKTVKVTDAGVFNFQNVFGLSENNAKKISDHFPIEFKLW